MTLNLATTRDLQDAAQRVTKRFDAFESRFALMLQITESRIVLKLAVWMTFQLGLAVALLVLFP